MEKNIGSRVKYLHELQRLLLWRYDHNEIRDILNDYNEFFEVGMSEGKSEEEICMGLGEPQEIIEDLEIELNKKKNRFFNYFTKKAAIRTFIMLLSLSVIVYLISDWRYNPTLARNMIIGLPIVLIGIWFCLGGKLYTLPFVEKEEKRSRLLKLILFHGICFLLLMFTYFVFYLIVENAMKVDGGFLGQFISIEPSQMGPIVSGIYEGVIAIVFLLLIYWLSLYRKYSASYFSLICHGIGVIASILCLLNMLQRMISPDEFQKLLQGCFFVYLVGLILTAAFVLYLKLSTKGVR